MPAPWGRYFGQWLDKQWAGSASPEFDSSILGLQVGADLVSLRMASGHVDKIGVFFAYAQAAGDLSALAVGRQQSVGHERINGYGVGGYWTHVGPSGWYVDSVLTGLWFDGNATSDFGTGINTSRNSLVASVEGVSDSS